MHLRIQRGSGVPISRQIDAQIRAQILSGVLRTEQPLPSVRQLARELAVNVNTIVRVYEKLAAEGLIEMRHGEGSYVTPQALAPDPQRLAAHQEELAGEFDGLVRRGRMLGLNANDLRRLLSESLQRVRKETSPAQLDSRKRGDSV